MTESEIDTQVKKFWETRELAFPEEFLQELENAFSSFQDVNEDVPGTPAEFLSYLDLGFAEKLFKRLYKREPTYPAEAMMKALFLMDIKRMKFYPELERYLGKYLEEAIMLGFPVKEGKILTPKRKNLWHFVNIRMKGHWDEFFRLMRNAVVTQSDELNLPIGREVIEDATPIEALKNDSEAEYNDHYEKSGYKLDTVTDLNTGLPLSKQIIGITDDEAKCFIPHLDEILTSEMEVTDAWIDGGYDDYPNIAWAGVHGIDCHHHIHENWVHNPKGDLENIVELYQKYWNIGISAQKQMSSISLHSYLPEVRRRL